MRSSGSGNCAWARGTYFDVAFFPLGGRELEPARRRTVEGRGLPRRIARLRTWCLL